MDLTLDSKVSLVVEVSQRSAGEELEEHRRLNWAPRNHQMMMGRHCLGSPGNL